MLFKGFLNNGKVRIFYKKIPQPRVSPIRRGRARRLVVGMDENR